MTQQSESVTAEPFAWVVLSEETGNTRMWTRNGDMAKEFAAKHLLECIELYRSPVRAPSQPAASGGVAELQAEIERLTDEVGAYAMALEQCRHHTPAQSMPIPKGELTKIASECHRAKWQFDLSEDFQPSKSSARALILQAFHEIHRIGDIALKLRDATALSSTDGDQ